MNRTIPLFLSAALFAGCPGEDNDPQDSGVRSDAGGSNADAGSGPDSGAADAGGNTSPNAAALAERVCAKQASCCPGNAETVEECRESISRVFEPVFTLPGIVIDEAAYGRCLTRLEALSCDDAANYAGRPPIPLICEPFYSGGRANGEACGGSSIRERFFEDSQCTSGSCNGDMCGPRVASGESCMEAECEEGLICFQGTCLTPEPQGADCSQMGYCVEPYACFGEPMTCGTPTEIAVGEVCEAGTICVLGESQCFCPLGQEGCIRGSCGNRTRCLAN